MSFSSSTNLMILSDFFSLSWAEYTNGLTTFGFC